ncbi:DUF2971 domain-containing protein [Ensifer sp. ENS08]|uniref:DUF2971 domain-containing protein n=1 Tax=Ensifer sp. ENS08 TaxID=2769273 RepID=UPI00177D8E5A|nr:DUF2971 domain-containing protein [Ensifer sp. ENS08]MBD9569018.1 DUF2971 domain-containing protein [Ensifer sp. ENS08]
MSKIRLEAVSTSLAQTYGRLVQTDDADVLFKGDGPDDLLCSQCEYLIGRNIQTPIRILNGVVQCRRCGVHLHLRRPSRYDQPVSMIASTPQLTTGKYLREIPTDAAPKLFTEATCLWRSSQEEVPNLLYHYTNVAGLQGIIGNSEIWSSDVSFLNDASELQYAFSMVSEVVQEISGTFTSEARSMLAFSSDVETLQSAESSVHAICFCEDNDLLSQWRAYGNATEGYCLGFESKQLNQIGTLLKVCYDPVQQKRMIAQTIEAFGRSFDLKLSQGAPAGDLIPLYAPMLQSILSNYAVSFKHPSFHEENEWRIVAVTQRDEDLDRFHFRTVNQRLVPYTKRSFESSEPPAPRLPLVSVTQGPTLTPQLNAKSLHLFLEKTGYAHVELLGSSSPLRA